MTLQTALVEHCSPTLAGVKVGNMFRFVAHFGEDIETLIKQCEAEIFHRGIRISILKKCTKTSSYLLYVYREKQLENLFLDAEVRNFMKSCDYCQCSSSECYIEKLAERMRADTSNSFPHEVGIFLGYPLCDVVGFIENEGKNYTCSEQWKSYGNPIEANHIFRKLRRCTEIYKTMFAKGMRLKDLAV